MNSLLTIEQRARQDELKREVDMAYNYLIKIIMVVMSVGVLAGIIIGYILFR